MKKSQTKTIIKILVSFFALYLCIYYWQGISGIIGSVLKAALPILVGCVIAYPLNILMSFYERHFSQTQIKNSYAGHGAHSVFYLRLQHSLQS